MPIRSKSRSLIREGTMTSNHRAGYGAEEDKIEELIAFLRRYPDCTLASGQAKLLLKRIDQLEAKLNGE